MVWLHTISCRRSSEYCAIWLRSAFWPHEREALLLTPGTFSVLKTTKSAFAAGAPPPTSLGRLQRAPDPLAGFQKEGRGRAGRSGRRGRKGFQWKGKKKMMYVSVCYLYCLSLSVTLRFWWINLFKRKGQEERGEREGEREGCPSTQKRVRSASVAIQLRKERNILVWHSGCYHWLWWNCETKCGSGSLRYVLNYTNRCKNWHAARKTCPTVIEAIANCMQPAHGAHIQPLVLNLVQLLGQRNAAKQHLVRNKITLIFGSLCTSLLSSIIVVAAIAHNNLRVPVPVGLPVVWPVNENQRLHLNFKSRCFSFTCPNKCSILTSLKYTTTRKTSHRSACIIYCFFCCAVRGLYWEVDWKLIWSIEELQTELLNYAGPVTWSDENICSKLFGVGDRTWQLWDTSTEIIAQWFS